MSSRAKSGILIGIAALLLVALVVLGFAAFGHQDSSIKIAAAPAKTENSESSKSDANSASQSPQPSAGDAQPSPTKGSAAGAQAAPSSAFDEPQATQADQQNTFSGTIRVMPLNELMGVLGMDKSPNGESSSTMYNVFVLDQASPVVATSMGNKGALMTKPARVIGLKDSYADSDGQHVIMHFPTESTSWPSDTSMPLGAPRTDAAEIVG